jgi:hypothetical protein
MHTALDNLEDNIIKAATREGGQVRRSLRR